MIQLIFSTLIRHWPFVELMKRRMLQRLPQVALTWRAFFWWLLGEVMTQQSTRTSCASLRASASSPVTTPYLTSVHLYIKTSCKDRFSNLGQATNTCFLFIHLFLKHNMISFAWESSSKVLHYHYHMRSGKTLKLFVAQHWLDLAQVKINKKQVFSFKE